MTFHLSVPSMVAKTSLITSAASSAGARFCRKGMRCVQCFSRVFCAHCLIRKGTLIYVRGKDLNLLKPLSQQGFSLLKIADFEELQSNRNREVEDVDKSRGPPEIGFGPGHA